ncbi:hypothetical protein K505DRAFT_148004 [Melanomma pulvis-pyrius CBS 109.77]|uniref:Uncharacterized protein n=1 Tax=Melanomma pulvis-pyrius CBS 109.77 TaxID=1314802 RepID=A0A6A6WQG6_9PLEO|nr:hypothetical protein K505DRAFT_148004 [Melanomma pulvis-pyrius CBS 109.77]
MNAYYTVHTVPARRGHQTGVISLLASAVAACGPDFPRPWHPGRICSPGAGSHVNRDQAVDLQHLAGRRSPIRCGRARTGGETAGLGVGGVQTSVERAARWAALLRRAGYLQWPWCCVCLDWSFTSMTLGLTLIAARLPWPWSNHCVCFAACTACPPPFAARRRHPEQRFHQLLRVCKPASPHAREPASSAAAAVREPHQGRAAAPARWPLAQCARRRVRRRAQAGHLVLHAR